jgi:hypothetical protein
MIILTVFAVLMVAGLLYLASNRYGAWDTLAFCAATIGGIGVAVCAMTIPLDRMGWQSTFIEIEAIRETRGTDSASIEDAAWRMKAAEVNAKLASGRYYNSTLFDIWIPDQVNDVDPIK